MYMLQFLCWFLPWLTCQQWNTCALLNHMMKENQGALCFFVRNEDAFIAAMRGIMYYVFRLWSPNHKCTHTQPHPYACADTHVHSQASLVCSPVTIWKMPFLLWPIGNTSLLSLCLSLSIYHTHTNTHKNMWRYALTNLHYAPDLLVMRWTGLHFTVWYLKSILL